VRVRGHTIHFNPLITLDKISMENTLTEKLDR
jgi:hypothetical protein